jgi:hypothetical protein
MQSRYIVVHANAERDGETGREDATHPHTHTHKLSSREGDFLSVLLSAAQNNSIKPLSVPEIKGAEGVK